MKDFTKGPIMGALFGLAVPIVLTNLLHTAYQLVDTFWVGRLGAEAVAAVSLSFPAIFLMISVGSGFSIAGTILVAQYKGKGDDKQVQHVTAQTMVLVVLVSAVLSLIGYFIAEPTVRLMGAEPNVLPDAASYLRVSFIGMTFMFMFFVFQSLMRGVGEVKTPMQIVFGTVMLNLFLDPLFINGYGSFEGMGVTGAAVATILTQGLATVAGLYILFKGKRGIKLTFKGFKFDWPLVKKMFMLGLPSSVEQSMKALGFMIMSFLVASFGTMILAAYGIGFRMLSFVIIPAFGLSMATSTLVGQNMGAGKPDRAEMIGKKSAMIGFWMLVLLGGIFAIFAKQIVTAFIPGDVEVIKEAAFFLRILCIAFGFIGLQLTLSGVFQGSGNTRMSMILSLISLWMFEFPIAYVLSHHTGLGSTGLWVAYPISAALTALISYGYFRFGRWKEMQLIDQTEDAKLEREILEEVMIEEGF